MQHVKLHFNKKKKKKKSKTIQVRISNASNRNAPTKDWDPKNQPFCTFSPSTGSPAPHQHSRLLPSRGLTSLSRLGSPLRRQRWNVYVLLTCRSPSSIVERTGAVDCFGSTVMSSIASLSRSENRFKNLFFFFHTFT